MQTHKTTKSYNYFSSMCVCVCIFWLKPLNALRYTIIQLYMTPRSLTKEIRHHKKNAHTVCFWNHNVEKRQQGDGWLWERCAREGRALSVRVLSSVFASDRVLVCAYVIAWEVIFRERRFLWRLRSYRPQAFLNFLQTRTHTYMQTHTLGLNNKNAWHTNQTTFSQMLNKIQTWLKRSW